MLDRRVKVRPRKKFRPERNPYDYPKLSRRKLNIPCLFFSFFSFLSSLLFFPLLFPSFPSRKMDQSHEIIPAALPPSLALPLLPTLPTSPPPPPPPPPHFTHEAATEKFRCCTVPMMELSTTSRPGVTMASLQEYVSAVSATVAHGAKTPHVSDVGTDTQGGGGKVGRARGRGGNVGRARVGGWNVR